MSKNNSNVSEWDEIRIKYKQTSDTIKKEVERFNQANNKIFEPLVGRYFQTQTSYLKILNIIGLEYNVVNVVAAVCKMNTTNPEVSIKDTYILLDSSMIELTKEEFIERVNKRMDHLKKIINQ